MADPVTIMINVPRSLLLTANQRLHWARKAERTRHLRTLARVAWVDARRPQMRAAKATVFITWPDLRRRDPENLEPTVKALIDGFVAAGLLPDDDYVHLVGPDKRVNTMPPAMAEVRATKRVAVRLSFLFIPSTPKRLEAERKTVHES